MQATYNLVQLFIAYSFKALELESPYWKEHGIAVAASNCKQRSLSNLEEFKHVDRI